MEYLPSVPQYAMPRRFPALSSLTMFLLRTLPSSKVISRARACNRSTHEYQKCYESWSAFQFELFRNVGEWWQLSRFFIGTKDTKCTFKPVLLSNEKLDCHSWSQPAEDIQSEDIQLEDIQLEDIQLEDIQLEDIQSEDILLVTSV